MPRERRDILGLPFPPGKKGRPFQGLPSQSLAPLNGFMGGCTYATTQTVKASSWEEEMRLDVTEKGCESNGGRVVMSWG